MEVLQRTANRGSVSTGYNIDNSCKFEADNSEKLSRSQTTGTNRKKFTVSFWVKRTEIGAFQVLAIAEGSGNDISFLDFESDDFLRFRDTASASDQCILETNRVFRDSSAWYHIVLRVDTTLSTADDRARIYVNGVQETSFSTRTNFDQNDDTFWGYNGGSLTWGNALGEANYYSGYVAEAVYVDGQSLAPTSFGEVDDDTGIWKPIDVSSLTFGNNGYYLDFEDGSNMGNDASGGTDFSETNIAAADQATDTPTNNFCTINPLINYYGSVSEGATKFLHTSGGDGWESFVATMGAGASGKWYAEFKFVASGSVDNFIGICPIDDPDLNRGADHFPYYGADTSLDESVGYYAANGYRYIGGGGSAYGNTWAVTNIMSIAVDMDNEKLYFAKDGVWQNSGDPTSGATGTGALDVRGATKPQSLGGANYTAGQDILANYGGYTTISISSAASDAKGYGTFEYAPPSGYYALCTKNLAEFG